MLGRLLCGLILLLLSVGASTAERRQTAPLLLVTEDLWPLNYLEDGKLKGTTPPLVKTLMDGTGLDYHIRVLPWARAYKLAKDQPNVLIFSMHRTPARESQFQWIGRLAPASRLSLFRRTSDPSAITRLSQAKHFSVAAKINDFNYEFLKAQGFTRLHPVASLQQCIRMLLRGRVDLIVGNQQVLHHYMKQMDLQPELITEAVSTSSGHLYLATGSRTAPSLVNHLRDTYHSLVTAGELPHFEDKPN